MRTELNIAILPEYLDVLVGSMVGLAMITIVGVWMDFVVRFAIVVTAVTIYLIIMLRAPSWWA